MLNGSWSRPFVALTRSWCPWHVMVILVTLSPWHLVTLSVQAAPKVATVFPLGAQRGTEVEVEFRGTGLEGAYAVWSGPGTRLVPASPTVAQHTKSTHGFEAYVKAVQGGYYVKARLVLATDTRLGFHSLSLIASGGLSNSIAFWVGPDPVIQEGIADHNTPQTAQVVKLPVGVNGQIIESGQLAYYAFDLDRAQTLAFEVVSSQGAGFDPQLALYESGGGFLDPRRSRRLLFHEEVTHGGMPANRRMTHQFTKPGRYLINIGNVFAQGTGDFSYLLRIVPADRIAAPEDALTWGRRRLQELRARSLAAPALEAVLVKETESNDDPEQAQAFSMPAVLEGTIGRPGDVDHFRFKAKAGQKLAFEVQTPRAGPPHFNLRLDVLNARKEVVLSNLTTQDGKLGTVDAKLIQAAPEVLGRLDADGEYVLRVRDLTSLHGGADRSYRVLVRPQVPHLGAIRVQPDGPVNLHPGARQRLTLGPLGNEDYPGTLALSVEGLPQGVKAFVGGNGSTVELVADTSAPTSLMPEVIRILGLPSAEGKSGSAFTVAEVPVMVVKR